jgi:hypothetical protein
MQFLAAPEEEMLGQAAIWITFDKTQPGRFFPFGLRSIQITSMP